VTGEPSGADRAPGRKGRVRPFFVPAKHGTEQALSEKLNRLLQPLVEDLGYEFVGLEYYNQPNQSVLRVYIDAENGIGLEDCESVSREVAALLDVEDPISGHYNLEVSSPGLDRPLFTLDQFDRFKGEEAKVTVYAPVDGRRKFKGRILGVEDGQVRMEQEGAEVALVFDNIAKARLVPDYAALMAGGGKSGAEHG
jgi:ribosome maturation factor RimP